MTTDRTCDCHEKPLVWNKDKRYKAGGFWRCGIKRSLSVRQWEAKNPAAKYLYKCRDNARRARRELEHQAGTSGS